MVSPGEVARINFQQMKKIEAIILSSNLNAIRQGLECRGIRSGLTVIDVRHGDSEKRFLQAGNGSSKTLRDRIKIELIVEDSETETTVNVILRQAQSESDEQGGQITVLEVAEIQRVARR
jgi:nitrogen regulatory protein PII